MPESDEERRVREIEFRVEVQTTLKHLHDALEKREESSKEQWAAIARLGERMAKIEAGESARGGVAGGVTGTVGGAGGAGAVLLAVKLIKDMMGG